ncbi:MAG: hypothetical protein E7589_08155 [Ruminococcaceae bacterium]|nr:hypothetical protein [Oscillospiraceae bacterium]
MKKLILKIVISIVAGLLGLVILALAGLNLAKFVIYSEYYSVKTDLCKNPGLGDGFVCQGICADEDSGKILVSGYMMNDSASRIYVTDKENNSYYVSLSADGKAFMGHVGGVATDGNKVYVASDAAINILSFDILLAAKNGDILEFENVVPVNNEASFIFADDEHLYVGEFHDGTNYVTDHPYTTPDGKFYAIVSRYSYDDLTAPDKIYSIRNKVQGFCVTPEGDVVLSTSYGLADSYYYVYSEAEAIDSGLTLDGAPVYYLNGCKREIKGPAMAEGLDWLDGKVITLTESASNKYIFGKFFFADKIVALDLKK